jgi:probable F420-dependent oxidoreductase
VKFAVQHGIGDKRWVPEIISPREVKRFAQTAERLGFDAISFTDHPAPSDRWVDSGGEGVADLFTSLGFCAAVTSTIRLMTFVLLPTYREGRVILGMGTGYLKSEFYALGVDPNNRRERFEEAMIVCKQVWAGQDVTKEGYGYSARGVRSVPAAVQRPHPPLWLHGNTDWAIDWVVREGQGWMGMMIGEDRIGTLRTRAIPTLEAYEARLFDVRAACECHRRDPATIEISNNGIWSMLDIQAGLNAEKMRDDVGRLANMGVDWIAFNICGHEPDASIDTLEWFASEIIHLSPGA